MSWGYDDRFFLLDIFDRNYYNLVWNLISRYSFTPDDFL